MAYASYSRCSSTPAGAVAVRPPATIILFFAALALLMFATPAAAVTRRGHSPKRAMRGAPAAVLAAVPPPAERGVVVVPLYRPDASALRVRRYQFADDWRHPQAIRAAQRSRRRAALSGTEISPRQFRMLLRSASGSRKSAAQSSLMQLRSGTGRFLAEDSDGDVSGMLKLSDVAGSEYVGVLNVGGTASATSGTQTLTNTTTPPSTELAAAKPLTSMRVVYDTGSSDLWIFSDLCSTRVCRRSWRTSFNHSESVTFHEPQKPLRVRTEYGSGVLMGQIGIDNVWAGPLLARNQTVGLIDYATGDAFERLNIDGIVGLGFPALAAPGAQPLVDTLMEQGKLPTREFAFFLHRDPAVGGALLWGGVAPGLTEGKLQWFPVVEQAYWAVELIALRVGNYTVSLAHSPPPQLVFDSGTTFFAAPRFAYGAIMSRIHDAKCHELSTMPSLVFTLRDFTGTAVEVHIKPETYMVRSWLSEGLCSPGIMDMGGFDDSDVLPAFMFGEVFMRHYLTVFRREGIGQSASARSPALVGFAPSRQEGEAAERIFGAGQDVHKQASPEVAAII
eukprot:TRINITY_DN21035_c0_g2_i1.p1 TRINITY_DN21035_c0_g2~~TRINITY_DN21035_c0_g2_i1.p1  ORF type:complete len:562 (+),score=100.85 TRINITY_DN21035_c0_g2_i1:125-1810(+)